MLTANGSEGASSFEVVNPATRKKIAEVIDGDTSIMQKGIDSAYNAFKPWSKLTANARAELLEKWYAHIMENKDALSELITLECGKRLSESQGEVIHGASFVKWFAEEGKRIYGDIIPPFADDRRMVVIKQPIGVIGAITPWNFPMAMITRKVAPALAAGCTVVVRPSEETPLTALAMAKLAEEAGFPAGVFNVVVGKNPAHVGKLLCESPKVSKISFTGSTAVGKLLMSQSASTLKKLSLELGGNAPFIVFEDADVDKAIQGAIASKFLNSGQTCICVNRFLVHEKIYDEFISKLTKAVADLKVGNGFDEGVKIGPIINDAAMQKTAAFVQDALEKGGTVLTGGKSIDQCYYLPTVIGNATGEMKIAVEEIFGPVAGVFTFSSDEEAIRFANNTPYGLASYVYSKNISRCWQVAEAMEFGMVGINDTMIFAEAAPFGGIKYSGQGREGSKYGIEEYVELKYMCFGGI